MRAHRPGWSAGLIGLTAGFALAIAIPIGAQTFPDTYQISYYDIATSASPSASGYGGPGASGGAGDNVIRIINSTVGNGTLCAMIYVFDDFGQMQACCGCPVAPNAMRTLTVANNLIGQFHVNQGDVSAGMIEIVGSTANFTPGLTSPAPPPPGTNGCTGGHQDPNCSLVSATPSACSPAGADSTDPRSSSLTPASGLRSRITHNELGEPGAGIAGGQPLQAIGVEAFQSASLDTTALSALQSQCQDLLGGASGAAFCTCGSGNVNAAQGRQISREGYNQRDHR